MKQDSDPGRRSFRARVRGIDTGGLMMGSSSGNLSQSSMAGCGSCQSRKGQASMADMFGLREHV